MDLGEMLALILLIFGTAVGGLILWKLFDVVRSSIKGNNSGTTAEDFDRLVRAFMQHKKETGRRLQRLEAAVLEEENEVRTPGKKSSSKQVEAPKKETIIENQPKDKKQSRTGNSDNLRNMLRE